MPAIAFDTLHYVKRLQKAGVPAEQAEAQDDVLSEAMSLNLDKLATKEDIEGLRVSTKADIKDMATKSDVAEVKTDVARLAGQMQIMIWVMGVMAAGMFGIIWVLLGIVEKLH